MDNKQKIINYLGKHIGESFTMHELSKTISMPYATFHRTVNMMSDLIMVKTIGKSKAVSIDTNRPSILSYLTVSSEEEKKDFLKTQPIIKKIAEEINTDDIVILFGSYAKGEEKPSSDIDLLIISKKGDKSISFSRYEDIFKKDINPIFITRAEFSKMLKEKDENVGKQALKNHIILSNAERFWESVLNG